MKLLIEVIDELPEDEVIIRNYDFHHYANISAYSLTYICVQKIFSGEIDDIDTDFLNEMLRYFKADDVFALKKQNENYNFATTKIFLTEKRTYATLIGKVNFYALFNVVAISLWFFSRRLREGLFPKRLVFP